MFTMRSIKTKLLRAEFAPFYEVSIGSNGNNAIKIKSKRTFPVIQNSAAFSACYDSIGKSDNMFSCHASNCITKYTSNVPIFAD